MPKQLAFILVTVSMLQLVLWCLIWLSMLRSCCACFVFFRFHPTSLPFVPCQEPQKNGPALVSLRLPLRGGWLPDQKQKSQWWIEIRTDNPPWYNGWWWFYVIFPYIGNNDPIWYWLVTGWWWFFYILGIMIPFDVHIFQRGRSTTNHDRMMTWWLLA